MNGKRTAMAFLLLAAGGCEPELVELSVPFEAVYGQQTLACGGASEAGRLTDLRFYVSDVRVYAGERAVEVQLTTDRRWQAPFVALVDLEDGEGACLNGTPGTNRAISGRIPAGDYRGISFVLGVPFSLAWTVFWVLATFGALILFHRSLERSR